MSEVAFSDFIKLLICILLKSLSIFRTFILNSFLGNLVWGQLPNVYCVPLGCHVTPILCDSSSLAYEAAHWKRQSPFPDFVG